MDRTHLPGRLSKLFWWLGHLTVAGVVVMISVKAWAYWHLVQSDGSLEPIHQFSLLQEWRSVAERLASGLFLYLVSSVMRMIQHRQPIRIERTRQIMQACCALYVLSAAFGFFRQCISFKLLLGGMDWYRLVNGSMTVFGTLTPFLYAVSIYVLYQHFANMMEFEAGVV